MSTTRTAIVLATALGASCALAAPIEYDFTGLATGSIGSTDFTNATLDISVVGDTSNVINPSDYLYQNFVDAGAATVTIGGIGTATISGDSNVFDYQGNDTVGFTINSLDRDDIQGYSPFGNYNLTTSIGPVGGTSDLHGALIQFNTVATSLGILDVTALNDNYFTAGTPAPEPVTLGLLGVSAIGLARRRFRAKNASK